MSSVKEFLPTPFYKGISKKKLRKIFLSLIQNEFNKQPYHKKISSQSFDNECTMFQPDQTENWSTNLKFHSYNNLRSPCSLHAKSFSYNFNSDQQNPCLSLNILAQLSEGNVSAKKQRISEKQFPFLKDYMQRIKRELTLNDDLAKGRHIKLKSPLNVKITNNSQNTQFTKEGSARKLGSESKIDKTAESKHVTLFPSYCSKINKNSDNLNKLSENYFVDPKQNKQFFKKCGRHICEFKSKEKDDRLSIRNKNDFKNTNKLSFVHSSDKNPGKENLESNKTLSEENKKLKEIILHKSPVENNKKNKIRETSEMRNDLPMLFSNVRKIVMGINDVINLHSSKPLSRSKSENVTLQKRKTKKELGLNEHVSQTNKKLQVFNNGKKKLVLNQKEEGSNVQPNVKKTRLQNIIMTSSVIPKIKFQKISKSEPSLKKKSDKNTRKSLSFSVPNITKLQKSGWSNYFSKRNEKLPSINKLWKKQTGIRTDFDPFKENRSFNNILLYSAKDIKEESQGIKGKNKINYQTMPNNKSKTNVNEKSFIKWQKMNKHSSEILENIRRKHSVNKNISINKQNNHLETKRQNRQPMPDYAMEKINHPVTHDTDKLNPESISEKGYSEHKFRKQSTGAALVKHLGKKYSAEFNKPLELENSESLSRKKAYLKLKGKDNVSMYNLKIKTNEIYYSHPKDNVRYEFGLNLKSDNTNNTPLSQSNILLYKKAPFAKNANKFKDYNKEYNNFRVETNKKKNYSHENKIIENLGKKKSLSHTVKDNRGSEKMNFHPISDTFLETKRAMMKRGKQEQKESLNDNSGIKSKNSYLHNNREEKKSKNKLKLTPMTSYQNVTIKKKEITAVHPFRPYDRIKKPVQSSACEKIGKVVEYNFLRKSKNEDIPAISLKENLISKFLMGKSEENILGTSYDRHIHGVTSSKYDKETFYSQKNKISSTTKNPKQVKSATKLNPFLDKKTDNKVLKSHNSTKFNNKNSSRNNVPHKKLSTNRNSKVSLFDEETRFKNKFKENIKDSQKEEYFDNEGPYPQKSSSYDIGKNERWNSVTQKKYKFSSVLDSANSLSRRNTFSRNHGFKSNSTPSSKIHVNSYDSIGNHSLSSKVLKDRQTKKQQNSARVQNKTPDLRNSNSFFLLRNNSAPNSKDTIEDKGNNKVKNKKTYLSKFIRKENVPQGSKHLLNQSRRSMIQSEMFTKKYHLNVDRGSENEIDSIELGTDENIKQSNVKLKLQDNKLPIKQNDFTKNVSFNNDFQKTLEVKYGNLQNRNNKILHRNVKTDTDFLTSNLKSKSTVLQSPKIKNQYSAKNSKLSPKEPLNIPSLKDKGSKMIINGSGKETNTNKVTLLETKFPNMIYTWDSLLKVRKGKSNDEFNPNNYFYNSFLKYKINEELKNKTSKDKNRINSKFQFELSDTTP